MSGKNILVVDDDTFVLPTLQAMISILGHTVHTANDGLDALSLIKKDFTGERRLDLIVSDIIMPNMPGPIMLKYLKDHPELGYSNIPAFLLSGYGAESYQDIITQLGVRVFQKPITMDELHHEVNKYLIKEHQPAYAEIGIHSQ